MMESSCIASIDVNCVFTCKLQRNPIYEHLLQINYGASDVHVDKHFGTKITPAALCSGTVTHLLVH